MACPNTATRPRQFVPDGRGGFRPSALFEWAEWLEANREMRPYAEGGHIVQCGEIGDAVVSTVFLGLDHNHFGDGPPILFETMIFGGEHDQYQARYETLAEAEEGHQRALELVNGS
jgi:hypothetical protein